MHRFAYFPGCSSKQRAAKYDLSARAAAEKLGIELVSFVVEAKPEKVDTVEPYVKVAPYYGCQLLRPVSLEIIKRAKEVGAECKATICPLCQLSLEIAKSKAVLPVYTFTQPFDASMGLMKIDVDIQRSVTLLNTKLGASDNLNYNYR